MELFFAAAGAMLFAALSLIWLVRSPWAHHVMDRPNQRSLHVVPVPRTGGLALVGGILVGWLPLASATGWIMLAPFLILSLVSFVDDWRGMSVLVRLLVHIVAVIGCVAALTNGSLGVLEFILVVLALVWMTNLFNFMDGADGLAGGMAFIGFLFLGGMAFLGGDIEFAQLNWVVAGVSLVFLLFNFYPARIFMGDVGSIPLGFLAAASGLAGYLKDIWPAWAPILIFSPFIVDATLTLLKRLFRQERVWEAHREHYYQRYILLGHGHRKTAWLEYGLMSAVGLTALWGVQQAPWVQATLLGGWTVVYIVLVRLIDSKWSDVGNEAK